MGNGALHSGDLRFNQSEATGQLFAERGAVLEEGQDFGAGKVGYITGAAGLARFLQNAILILAEAKVDDAVADFGRHRIQVSFMRQAEIATAVPVQIIGFGQQQKFQAIGWAALL